MMEGTSSCYFFSFELFICNKLLNVEFEKLVSQGVLTYSVVLMPKGLFPSKSTINNESMCQVLNHLAALSIVGYFCYFRSCNVLTQGCLNFNSFEYYESGDGECKWSFHLF